MPFTSFFLLPFLLLYNSPPAVIFRHLLALSLIAHLRRTLYSLSLSSFMTPVYQKSPFVDQKEEDRQRFKLFSFSANQASSSISCAASFSTVRDQKGCQLEDHKSRQTLDDDLKVGKSLFFGKSTDQEMISSPSSSSSPVTCEEKVAVITGNGEKDHSSESDLQGSVKWMSSKKRIMQEMVNKDAEAEAAGQNSGNRQYEKSVMASSSSISNSNNITIRVCSDCKTTTTPLWRSGPEGPKSLCNACGIRQRKARRAMAEAAGAAANSRVVSCSSPSLKQKKEKKSRTTSHDGQNKSKIKLTDTGNGERKLSFNNLALGLGKTSAFGRVFPRDEEEATILLMELSRGIVHG